MNKTLIIVESPAKCQKIENYLGSSLYKCIASYGHLREMNTKKGLSCINFENFNINYQPVFKQYKNIEKLKSEINKAKDVIIATDDDREGEAIGWHICKMFNLPIEKTERIIFHEVTKPALEKAIKNPIRINMNMVNSQQTRQIIDLIVGFNMSPLLWKHIKSGKPALSAGRCQTPALKIVYDNENEIRENPGEFLHTIYGVFKGETFELNKNFDTIENVKDFMSKSITHKYKISNNGISKVNKNPPSPFTTSSLQQRASSVLHYSPKSTMAICQNLYEAGYITYMRTDNKNYSQDFIKDISKYIDKKYGNNYFNNELMLSLYDSNEEEKKISEKKKSKNKKISNKTNKNNDMAQEAHEAIRPTNINTITVELKGKITYREKRMYEFIRNNTLESCIKDAIYHRVLSSISAPDAYKYTSSFLEMYFDGWHKVQNINETSQKYNEFKRLKDSEDINYDNIYTKYTLLHKKQHINEAKLVKLLEDKGIGRPSTFSSIVSKIQDRGYVKIGDVEGSNVPFTEFSLISDTLKETKGEKNIGGEKNKLIITPIGTTVIEFLIKHCEEIFNYDYTSEMEKKLDLISKGNGTKIDICKQVDREIKTTLSKINIEGKVSYKIDDDHVFKFGKYGATIETSDEDGNKQFYKVPDNVDINKIKDGKYDINDLKTLPQLNKKLGKYKNKLVTLKNGKYGLFVTYDKKNISVKSDKDDSNILLEDVIQFIENKINPSLVERSNQDKLLNNEKVIRIIDDVSQLRKGKFGNYIFYQTETMKKPKFISIKKPKNNINFEIDDIDIIKEWIREQNEK